MRAKDRPFWGKKGATEVKRGKRERRSRSATEQIFQDIREKFGDDQVVGLVMGFLMFEREAQSRGKSRNSVRIHLKGEGRRGGH